MKRWIRTKQDQLNSYIVQLAKDDVKNNSIIDSYSEFRKLSRELDFEATPGLYNLYESEVNKYSVDNAEDEWDARFGEPCTQVYTTDEFNKFMEEVIAFTEAESMQEDKS